MITGKYEKDALFTCNENTVKKELGYKGDIKGKRKIISNNAIQKAHFD